MPTDTFSISATVGILTALGLSAAAVLGGWYFFSSSDRAQKQKQWKEEGGMKAVSEWGEWLLGLLALLLLVGAAIGITMRGG